MQPRIRIGLIVGVLGLVLSSCPGFLGFLVCGPVIALIVGGIAGSLAARQEKPATKNQGARVGATAGGIAGALMILGQTLGTLASILYLRFAGTPIDIQVPFSLSGDPAGQMGYYVGSVAIALCIGIAGALLAAGAGAGTGYLITPESAS